ncbi:hypothetical protein GCM10023214_52980 [Amycolatopsis dongchuanensis]|uniref:Transposase n=1 Tax=Amycolatopsis dongchuanensis TaxID=1070866 RepID=A0ABP9R5S1_9PSEU
MERYNRTLQTEWAYRRVFTSHADRTTAPALGSSPTTLNDATAHSAATHPPADYHPMPKCT